MKVLTVTIALALAMSGPALAADTDRSETIDGLILVSDRSAPSLVAAAHQFVQRADRTNIQIRTVSQLHLMDDEALDDLIRQASGMLIIAVFGEAVERLLARRYPAEQLRLVIGSDRRLFALHSDSISRYQSGLFSSLSDSETTALFQRLNDIAEGDYRQQLDRQQQRWPRFRIWLQARAYWQNQSTDNLRALLALLVDPAATWAPLEPVGALRFFLAAGDARSEAELESLLSGSDKETVFILDGSTGDRPGDWKLHQRLCAALGELGNTIGDTIDNTNCISVLAGWGMPSVDAVRTLEALSGNLEAPYAIVSLQDFVVGGGDGREEATASMSRLNVPVFKGVRLTELTTTAYQLSARGLPADSVHYRIAMPELQGIGQAHVLAVAEERGIDAQTGAQVSQTVPLQSEVDRLVRRLNGWFELRRKDNRDKKVAIVFYNHPPGRHNIGADNLNVPESLWQILQSLRANGYDLGPPGELPASAAELLDLLQQNAVNLPQDAKAMAAMADRIVSMDSERYADWFSTLPNIVQHEMTEGPLGLLHERLRYYLTGEGQAQISAMQYSRQQRFWAEAEHLVDTTMHDIHHALDGIRHPERERALQLLSQLHELYRGIVGDRRQGTGSADAPLWPEAAAIKAVLVEMRLEGLRGWGEAPGEVMVWDGRLQLPGIRFGNVFLGPQPPRGWELHEELLHANTSFPPPHQYLAFYHYLADEFGADALVHVGRHSTYEFLPRRATGLSATDYPSIIVGDIPSIYPYIVDGVGEGIQAKRRGMAVMVDHLTPPLATTELYDGLLELRQLIESAEAAGDPHTKGRAVLALRQTIDEMNLHDELAVSMEEELNVRGANLGTVDDDFLLHEVGHYLTKLQEAFMPLGLHVFGRPWPAESVDVMLESIVGDDAALQKRRSEIRAALAGSPDAEMAALIDALNGGFVDPGKGNDPVRTPEALPTGRNFYALDGSLLPTKVGADIGRQLAKAARKNNPVELRAGQPASKEAVILWASDTVRDEGAMIAFGLDMMGIQPVWSSRGILKDLELLDLTDQRPQRRDVLFTSSGLFRDLYGSQLELLDKAVLLSLAASENIIERDYPALADMLRQALAPVAPSLEKIRHEDPGWRQDESLDRNLIARNWVLEARALLAKYPDASQDRRGIIARQATARVFGTAPGAYGAGINRLVERSGSWQEREQLGAAYIKRMSHVYGMESAGLSNGSSAKQLFTAQLGQVGRTYLGRASNLYGLMDNNDAFDYLGGLNLAIETVTGAAPDSYVTSHADNRNLEIESLQTALLTELRGRFLNRQWIEPLMEEGYSGARTMGSGFVEYLWGWQVTSPDIIHDWVWDDVKAIYIDDSLELGLSDFLRQGHNVHVQTNMLAVMLVAIDKGFWQADELTTAELAEAFAKNIVQSGIPGSGHTHAHHPVYNFVLLLVNDDLANELQATLAESRLRQDSSGEEQGLIRVQEAILPEAQSDFDGELRDERSTRAVPDRYWVLIFGLVALLLVAGFLRSRRLR